jgi:alpha-L-fucosidase 2
MPHPASRQSTLDHAEAGYVQPYPAGYLRSYADIVTILPALPEGWPSGKARGLRVRGGDAVDLEWRDGVLSSLVLHASATRGVTIDVPGDGPVRIRRRVSLRAGETVTVVAP